MKAATQTSTRRSRAAKTTSPTWTTGNGRRRRSDGKPPAPSWPTDHRRRRLTRRAAASEWPAKAAMPLNRGSSSSASRSSRIGELRDSPGVAWCMPASKRLTTINAVTALMRSRGRCAIRRADGAGVGAGRGAARDRGDRRRCMRPGAASFSGSRSPRRRIAAPRCPASCWTARTARVASTFPTSTARRSSR